MVSCSEALVSGKQVARRGGEGWCVLYLPLKDSRPSGVRSRTHRAPVAEVMGEVLLIYTHVCITCIDGSG